MLPRPLANPPNRFDTVHVAYDDESRRTTEVQLLEDASRTIVSHNDSPDVGFEWSVNPYRGCMHACAYCYARPTHEYLGMGAGTDFDTKILVKRRAPELLREAFEKPSWKGDRVLFSGVTDCYQPVEGKLGLTRACLEVCAEYRNPVSLVTKSALVERDLDVLAALARDAAVSVRVSVPFFDPAKARAIEPWVPTPARRFEVIRRLADAGINVGVNVAPVIPGLTDEDVPQILEAAKDAGASSAMYILVRLPGAVERVFEERLRAAFPDRAERVLHLVRETRGGQLYDPRFGARMRGTGLYADSIGALFHATARRLGFDEPEDTRPAPATFRRPVRPGTQLKLL